uniref:Neuropeptide-Like Protein n=1 Tax=Panagrellus redivivus TaxID=6233 RepID=A0A7E4WAU5_PANRE
MNRFCVVFLALAFVACITVAQSADYGIRAKRAINPFMDSIGKRSQPYRFETYPKRYFDGFTGHTAYRRNMFLIPVLNDE